VEKSKNGNKPGDSLDNSQNDSGNPVRHESFGRETGATGKEEVTQPLFF
jgi:hypothetical protein